MIQVLKGISRTITRLALVLFLLFNISCTTINLKHSLNPLDTVNRKVNLYPYASDIKQFNKKDLWQLPEVFLYVTKKGDCEDYALAKAYLLLQEGVRKEKDLKILIVRKYDTGVVHAVLVVDNFWVLDNQTNQIVSLLEYKTKAKFLVFEKINERVQIL